MTRHYSKPPSHRQLQISHEIRSALADFFTKSEYYHPVLESIMITIPEVRISSDLKVATAFVILPDSCDKNSIIAILKEISPEVRKIITERLQLRFSPEIRFVLDETAENAKKINSIFDSLHKKS